jgi:hypothetical protein
VEFTATSHISPGSTISLGIDQNLSDGASITWTAPTEGFSAELNVGGRYPDQSHQIAYAPSISIFTGTYPTQEPLPTEPGVVTVGYINTVQLPGPDGVVRFETGQNAAMSWTCPPENTDEFEFVLISDDGNTISLGRSQNFTFYTKCFGDLARLDTTLPGEPFTGRLQGRGYSGGQLTSISNTVQVEINAPAP